MRTKNSYGFYITLIFIVYIIVVGCGSTKAPKVATEGETKASPTLKATTNETRDVTVSWDDVPGAVSYNIYWSDQPGVTKQNGTKIPNVKNPHKIAELKKGKKYYFVVTAVNASGESKESEELSITVGE